MGSPIKVYEYERKLFAAFEKAGFELYLVGGVVRDRLLSRRSKQLDLDFTTSARPEETQKILESMKLKTWDVGAAFGTISAMHMRTTIHRKIEITTFRAEVYRKRSRKPEVVFGKSLEDDLRRRDFTINAIAADAGGRLVDPFGGERDLAARLIRTPLDPVVTMQEDPLRMLRAVRFAARLGFELDQALRDAVSQHARDLEFVSRERWLLELDETLGIESGKAASAGIAMLASTGLLAVVLPELMPLVGEAGSQQGPWHDLDPWEHTLEALSKTGSDLDTRWAALLHDAGKPSTRGTDLWGTPHFTGHEGAGREIVLAVAERLRFPRKRREAVSQLVRLHMRPALYEHGWTDSAVRRLAKDAGTRLGKLMDLARADAQALARDRREQRLADLAELEERLGKCDVTERLLPRGLAAAIEKSLGWGSEEGPKLGRLIARLEEAVTDGELRPGEKPPYYLDWIDRNRDEVGRL